MSDTKQQESIVFVSGMICLESAMFRATEHLGDELAVRVTVEIISDAEYHAIIDAGIKENGVTLKFKRPYMWPYLSDEEKLELQKQHEARNE